MPSLTAFAKCLAVDAVVVGALCAFAAELRPQQSAARDVAQEAFDVSRQSKEAVALRVPPGLIRVDGRLDEPAWKDASPITDLIQKEPAEGMPPTELTEVRFMFDTDGLYVGARMGSSVGRAGIQAPLGRRDSPYSPALQLVRGPHERRSEAGGRSELADFILISLDTFLDRRTAYSFGVTASGVRIDHQHLSDSESDVDQRFDPVWEARTSIDDRGWTAEMWIPFSQLRFNRASELVWGLNVQRWIPAKNEDDYWVAVPRTTDAWSSRFGALRGIESVDPGRRLELLPYATARSSRSDDVIAGNPFRKNLDLEGSVGADIKMGLGPNLTLDAALHPDFGQVEVDPAVINLSDIETIYPERRPFFNEGSTLLDGPYITNFYSRRIGQRPEGPASGDFVDYPEGTTILGAAKVTGQLPSRTSVGVLAAVTAAEDAQTYDLLSDGSDGSMSDVQVAPSTLWAVGRAQQDWGENASNVSLMVTGVHRDVARGEPLASLLPRSAGMVNAASLVRFGGGAYELSASGWLTGINGDERAIARAQTGTERYFQRPDADHVRVDSSRTSLSGTKATLEARKISGTHWLWNVTVDVESPELTFNDIGRLGTADGIMTNNEVTYRETQPGSWFRSYNFTLSHRTEWNFGGVRQHTRLNGSAEITWSNFLRTQASVNFNTRSQDQRLTRGGPSMEAPSAVSSALSLRSNPSTGTRWSVRVSHGRDELGGWSSGLDGELSLVVTPRWQVSISPSWERTVDPRQFVMRLDGGSAQTFGRRYVFAFTDRTTLAMEARLDFTLKPDVNLEIYAQPFAASGRYFEHGELEAAGSRLLRSYGADGTTVMHQDDGTLRVQDGVQSFTVPNRDFNLRSFRSTTVVRWEWRPGSTLYLVWQQDRSRRLPMGSRSGIDDLFGSVTEAGTDVFAIKLSYWMGV